jgi:hypothetical protein
LFMRSKFVIEPTDKREKHGIVLPIGNANRLPI